MENLVTYDIKGIMAYWSDGYAPSFPNLGYTEFWVHGTIADSEREIVVISTPFRLDIYDAKTEELIKMRFDDDVQRENYATHKRIWEESALPYAQAIVAAFNVFHNLECTSTEQFRHGSLFRP